MTRPSQSDEPFDWDQIYQEAPLLQAKLVERADPAYAETLRRQAPEQLARGTRLSAIRRVVREWLSTRREHPAEYVVLTAEMLWSSGVREDRIAALALIFFHPAAREIIDFSGLDSWSRDLDSRELIDYIAALAGRKLEMAPRLLPTVRSLANSPAPYQRRLALMALVVASRDPAWEPGLAAMAERLSADEEPVVQDAVARARARLTRLKALTTGGS